MEVNVVGDAAGLIRGLQERAAHAFPAIVVEHAEGWRLRDAEGGAWWASSVQPHGDAEPLELPSRIRRVEDFYADHGAPVRFQISPGACPAGLDDALAERGYGVESPMSLQSAPTQRVIDRLLADGPRIRIDDQPADAWLAVQGTGPELVMLRRVTRPSGYALALSEAGGIAVGRAVADAGWAGIFGMATLPNARRRGAARAVLAALAAWAADHSAEHLYLQVEQDNIAARGLYERAGFTELCRYHYRTAPIEPHSADA